MVSVFQDGDKLILAWGLHTGQSNWPSLRPIFLQCFISSKLKDLNCQAGSLTKGLKNTIPFAHRF